METNEDVLVKQVAMLNLAIQGMAAHQMELAGRLGLLEDALDALFEGMDEAEADLEEIPRKLAE